MIIDAQVHAYERDHPGRPWAAALAGPPEVTGDDMVAAMDAVDVNGAFRYSTEVTVLLALDDFVFEPAFPNPFRSTTTLRFAVATAQPVVAELYNAMGQRVRTLYAGTPAAGEMQTLHIDHAGLTSGLYVVHLTGAGGFTATEKIMLVK